MTDGTRCPFAIVLIKPTGEHRIFRCIETPEKIEADGTHDMGLHVVDFGTGHSATVYLNPDKGNSSSVGRCDFSFTLQVNHNNAPYGTSCEAGAGHEGFHRIWGLRKAQRWVGATVRVYRDLPNRYLDTTTGMNHAFGVDPVHVNSGSAELPVFVRPKKEEPPPRDLLRDAKAGVRLHARRLLECWDEVIQHETDPYFLSLLEKGKVKLVNDLMPVVADPYFTRKAEGEK